MAQLQPTTDPVYRISLNRSLALRLIVWGTLLLYVAIEIAGLLLPGTARDEFFRTFDSPASMAWFFVAGMIVFLSAMVLHELIHGVAFRLFGGTPKYGVGVASRILPYAYATSPGDAFSLFEMSIVAIAPFVVISAGSVALMLTSPNTTLLAAVAFIANFSGAVGDLWMLAMIWRFRLCKDLVFVDTMTGMLVHTSDRTAAAILDRLHSPSRILWFDRIYRFIAVWGIAAVAALLITTGITAIAFELLLESNFHSLVVGPDTLPLIYFEQTPKDLAFYVNLPGLAFFALVAPLLDLWRQVRGSSEPDVLPSNDGVPRPVIL